MGGSDYICSGSVVTESNTGVSVVLTAGHCVVENDGTFATFWEFIPSFDTNGTYTCSASLYGCWVADELYAHKTFATAGGFNNTAVAYDWGFARLSTGGLSGTAKLDSTVGSFALVTSALNTGTTLSAFGYPAAGKYHGYDLTYCKGPIGTDVNTSNTTWSMPCDMTGGSSGGPWVQSDNVKVAAGTTLRSLNSYGYSGSKNMYGPKFNSNTQTTFNDAVAGSPGSSTVRIVLP
jgi:V8-like Glu-specific endopeptidase